MSVEKRRNKKKRKKGKRAMIIVAKSHEAFNGGFDLYEPGGRDMLAANAIVSLYRCISTRFIALNYN